MAKYRIHNVSLIILGLVLAACNNDAEAVGDDDFDNENTCIFEGDFDYKEPDSGSSWRSHPCFDPEYRKQYPTFNEQAETAEVALDIEVFGKKDIKADIDDDVTYLNGIFRPYWSNV